ncbi:ankyrin repeat domain-containing protein [Hafnia alvei]|uniref:ankyrin repeat domain-containing protein n=1 Tax=Hafnia alvei TaxID=569 RepID=UPI0026F3669F|nr:ankyrin repeat domain-containing protein [Hafnia alvei]
MNDDVKLESLFLKYQDHPDFYGAKITNVDQKSIDDDTMLHMAARAGSIEDIETLISGGANIDAIGDLGNTPLHQAAMFGQLKSIVILLKLKAKTTIRNEFNQIPADVARVNGYHELWELIKDFHPITTYPVRRKKKK